MNTYKYSQNFLRNISYGTQLQNKNYPVYGRENFLGNVNRYPAYRREGFYDLTNVTPPSNAVKSAASNSVPGFIAWLFPNNSLAQYGINYVINPYVGKIITVILNIIYAIIIFFFGGFGILAMRIFKWQWSNQLWSYIPIFWIPMTTSWIVSIAVLLGYFD